MGTSGTTSPPPGASRHRGATGAAPAVLLGVAAVAAFASLLLQFGQLERVGAFKWVGGCASAILWGQAAVLAMFAADRVGRLLKAADRREHLAANWFDLALPAGVALVAAGWPAWRVGALGAGVLYVLITQAYTAAAAIVRRTAARTRETLRGSATAGLVLGGLTFLGLLGSLLLILPVAVSEDVYFAWDYIDAVFTAISAVTCTGLTLKPTGVQFTFFGQAVILLLIQAGALAVLFAGAVLARLVGQSLVPAAPESALVRPPAAPTVRFVLTATLVCEAVGAILLYPMFAAARTDGPAPEAAQAAWYSVFHAVSAFCNAGFTLYPRGLMQGLEEGWAQPLRSAWAVYGVMAPLIVLGGLGMTVLGELARVPGRVLGRPGPGLSRHARIVLATSGILIVAGAALLLAIESAPRGRSPERLTEWSDDADSSHVEKLLPEERKLHLLPPGQRVLQSLFLSISARSAGFSTVDVGTLTPGSSLALCGLMTVGGAPGGSAGGVKVTVLAMLVLAAWGAFRGPKAPDACRRAGLNVLARAVAVVLAFAALVGVVAVLLCVATGWDSAGFLKILVESCSACANAGFSMEVSERLGRGMLLAKGALILGMLLGKAGLAALSLAMVPAPHAPDRAGDDVIV